MTILERIKESQSTIYLFFATILIIPFQVLLLGIAFVGSYNAIVSGFLITSESYYYLVAYFVLTIIYSIFASLLFQPKRIVSPINIQIGTIVIVSLFIVYQQLTAMFFVTTEQEIAFIGALALIVFFISAFLIMAGFVQFLVVRWVIGLNFDNVERTSYIANLAPKQILEALGDGFLDVWDFNRRKDNPRAKNPIWVLKCHDLYGNSIVLTIGTQTGKANESILATVAYRRSAYEISTSESASNMQKSIINDIKERLYQFDAKSVVSRIEKTDDPVSFKAYSHALSVTRSKTESTREFLKSIPRYYLYAISITIVTLFISTITYGFGFLDLGTYVSVAVGATIALLVELGVSLREELSHQEIEELD